MIISKFEERVPLTLSLEKAAECSYSLRLNRDSSLSRLYKVQIFHQPLLIFFLKLVFYFGIGKIWSIILEPQKTDSVL